jgi:hypothetical protein
MDFQQLVASMPAKTGSLWWLENGAAVGRSYSALHQDVKRVREKLQQWAFARERASASLLQIPGTGWSTTWR